jgi:hypothetical protein
MDKKAAADIAQHGVQLFKPGYWTQIAEGSLAIIEGRAPTSEIVFGRINLLNGEVLSISGTLDQILADLPCPVESFSFINATRAAAKLRERAHRDCVDLEGFWGAES